jgi:hypothetical protein
VLAGREIVQGDALVPSSTQTVEGRMFLIVDLQVVLASRFMGLLWCLQMRL